MFRVKESDFPPTLVAAAWAVAALLAAAFAAGLGVTALSWAQAPVPPGLAALTAALTALAAAAFLWLWRRNLAAQRALRQVKLLAHDILASMDQGVVTTGTAAVVTSINSGAMRLLGAGEGCVGHPLAALTSDEVPLDGLCRRVLERHERVRDQEFAL
jgi:PAS domain-containing protein